MLIIRLQRVGRTKSPFYRLVIAEKARHVSKKVVGFLGSYNPRTKILSVNRDKVQHWVDLNISMSDTAKSILTKEGFLSVKQKSS